MKASAIVTKRRYKDEYRDPSKPFNRQTRISGSSIIDCLSRVSSFISENTGSDVNFIRTPASDKVELVVISQISNNSSIKKWLNMTEKASCEEFSVILYDETGKMMDPDTKELKLVEKALGINNAIQNRP